jgi:hypothetical protein
MRRLHLVELEDLPRFPAVWRDAGTAYLRFAADFLDQPAAMAPKLRELLERTGVRRLVDLCSGGAGPIPALVERLRRDGLETTAILTDLYPNVKTLEAVARGSQGRVEVYPGSVDATEVPSSLAGCRVLCNALHHFRPDAARRILQNAADSGQPIAVFEVAERSPLFLLGILFAPIAFALACPFLRPFDWRWIVFTYLVPVIPFFVLWDGLVSGLRSYTLRELDEMAASVAGPQGSFDSFEWESGRVRVGSQPAYVTYLLGWPKAKAAAVAR